MNLAILGYGTIGSGIDEIVTKQTTAALACLNVTHILVRDAKGRSDKRMCDDMDVILQDPTVEVVMEVLGGIEPAHTYILAALSAGKHVVTANKAVVAKYMKDFHDCAKQHQVQFLYEASTGGGIPWIRSLAKVMRIDEVQQFKGIFNGTTNFILDHMAKESEQFDVILRKAQALGYAEKDPSADIDGIDIRNKLKITSSLAFHSLIHETFPVFGIRNICKIDIDYATKNQVVIKLMAEAKRIGDRYCCVVEPQLYKNDSIEANIQENFNIGSIVGESIGELKFYGQGAGKLPTANAIIQDVLDIATKESEVDVHFEQEMRFDTALLGGTYMLRSALAKAEIVSLFAEHYDCVEVFEEQTFYWIKHISSYQMHRTMQLVLDKDKDAFMARMLEDEAC